MKRIGGLWKHKSKDKNISYLGGEVEFLAGVKTKVLVFQAKEKKTDSSPDYLVYVGDGVKKVDKAKVLSEDVF